MSLRVYVYSIAVILLASSLVTAARTCTDSDDGKTFDVQGTVTGKGARNKDYSHEDSCINTGAKGRLLEWFCKGKVPKSMKKRCSCENGACITTTSTTRTTTTKTTTTRTIPPAVNCGKNMPGSVCKYSVEDCANYCTNQYGAGGMSISEVDCNTRWPFKDACCKCNGNYPCNASIPTSFCLTIYERYGSKTPEQVCSEVCSWDGRTMTYAGKADRCKSEASSTGICCNCQGSYQPQPEDYQPTQSDQQCWKDRPGAVCMPATEDCDKYCMNYGGRMENPVYGNPVCTIDGQTGQCCPCTKHSLRCNALVPKSIDLEVAKDKTGQETCQQYCTTWDGAYVKSADYSLYNLYKHVCCKCNY